MQFLNLKYRAATYMQHMLRKEHPSLCLCSCKVVKVGAFLPFVPRTMYHHKNFRDFTIALDGTRCPPADSVDFRRTHTTEFAHFVLSDNTHYRISAFRSLGQHAPRVLHFVLSEEHLDSRGSDFGPRPNSGRSLKPGLRLGLGMILPGRLTFTFSPEKIAKP